MPGLAAASQLTVQVLTHGFALQVKLSTWPVMGLPLMTGDVTLSTKEGRGRFSLTVQASVTLVDDLSGGCVRRMCKRVGSEAAPQSPR